MTPPPRIDVDRVVLEVPHLGYARPPWRWFELDLDQIGEHRLQAAPAPRAGPGIRVSAMTRRREAATIIDHLARPRSPAVTHLQYEVADLDNGRRAADAIRRAGLTPLPAIHLPHSPDNAAELERAVDLLTQLDAPLIKLAYPAPDQHHVDWGISLLASGRQVELALVPMGTMTGRAAAVAAGSRLIWAPPVSDGERWGADQLEALATPSISIDEPLASLPTNPLHEGDDPGVHCDFPPRRP